MAIDEQGKPLPDELKIDNIKNWEQMVQMIDDVERWKNWEEVPDEDLWEDSELDSTGVAIKIYSKVCRIGDWKLIRETIEPDFTNDKDDGRDREWEEIND